MRFFQLFKYMENLKTWCLFHELSADLGQIFICCSLFKCFCNIIADAIYYVKNLSKIINGFVSMIKQRVLTNNVNPRKHKKESSHTRPSYITPCTAMSGQAQPLLLCYSCMTAQQHVEDITHPKPVWSFSELSPSIISFCSLPSCNKYYIRW